MKGKKILAALLAGCSPAEQPVQTPDPQEEISLVLADPEPQGEPLKDGERMQTEFRQDVISIPDQERFSISTSEWSLRLLQELAEEKETNLLISPFSIGQAFGMAANGMKGDTQKEVVEFLGGGVSLSALNQEYAAQRTRLEQLEHARIHVANSLWYDGEISVNQEFEKSLAQYGAEFSEMDFADPQALDTINRWVEEQTEGKIRDLFSKFDDRTVLCLVNAVYFDARWKTEVPSYQVSRGLDFYTADGLVQKADYLSCSEVYLRAGEASGILKPYEDEDLAFLAILPDGELSDYLEGMSGEDLLELLDSAGEETADAQIPIFEIELPESLLLNTALQNLGVSLLFDPGNADLSGMGGEKGDLWVDQAVHKTFLRVDQNGTEAAAATGISVAEGAALAMERKTVVFNRPFLFAVMDLKTRTPLFLGVLQKIE